MNHKRKFISLILPIIGGVSSISGAISISSSNYKVEIQTEKNVKNLTEVSNDFEGLFSNLNNREHYKKIRNEEGYLE
ncbi:hypothetical protein EI74_0071 [Mycoplasma testudineum]|uniref:Uncharacterized protein n=1 Tax=Mycoplasma testudineum TaxID=244584 RepID=A0A4V6PSD1_9MOLU|nr:hypothetical protein [Mycoplasma testudineum]TDO21229.1 hypothetical protein EI74_0071 [Mycoplasma testudineum]